MLKRKSRLSIKILFAVLCICLFISAFPLQKTYSASADGASEIAMEFESGRILHEKSAQSRRPMASTTKIMTALIICEECDLDEVITVPDEAVGVEGSSIYLKYGEVISVRDLLYGLMLRSGNDAAHALAIHHSKTILGFVEKMNERAKELNALNTHFTNPSGLPDDEHYTTAEDLCNIARTAMKNQIFAEIVDTQSYTGQYRSYTNKNKLLRTLDGANGVKTGYTTKAGRCLVSSVKRGDMQVICVVLNCYDMYDRSSEILEACFNNYEVKTISKDRIFTYQGKCYSLDEDIKILLKKGESINYFVREVKENNNCVKLEISARNNLIFSRYLYIIN